jgi:DNA-binding NtrC family response regulator
VPALRQLAVALAGAAGAEAGAAALLDAAQTAFASQRSYVLTSDRERGGRLLLGRAPTSDPSSFTPVVARALLEAAAKQGRAVATVGPVEERTLNGGRTAVRSPFHAALVVPLVSREVVAGFLYVLRPETRPFSSAELAVGDAFGALAVLHGLGGVLAPASAPAPIAGGPVGASPAFARVLKLAAAAARTTSTVLITGESGTGKEEIAALIHRTSGRGPFVAVNCGAIPETLAETELFGHEKGAFTGAVSAREGRIEAADGGTLFLDEIGELAPALQVKLLRVLQERAFQRVGSATTRSVDLRVIAATHRALEADVAAGRFREDLFYRLNVVRIAIPPLRDRREDVPVLAAALLARLARALGRPDPGLTAGAQAWLSRAPWKGNARELGNVLERALVLREPGRSGALDEDEIADAAGDAVRGAAVGGPAPEPGAGLPAKVEALERAEIATALVAARGVKARAAKALGISRPTLDKKMAELDVDPWRDGPAGKGAS